MVDQSIIVYYKCGHKKIHILVTRINYFTDSSLDRDCPDCVAKALEAAMPAKPANSDNSNKSAISDNTNKPDEPEKPANSEKKN